jgi:hypothetical protein
MLKVCPSLFVFVYGFALSCSNALRLACTQRSAPAHTQMKFEILYACDTFFMYVQAFLSESKDFAIPRRER